MPKGSAAAEVVEDSASEGEPRSSKKKSDSNANAQSGDEGSDNGEDSNEEYEIEAILDAKHGAFPGVRSSTLDFGILNVVTRPQGRMGYLVKWKGYEEEHNSWVDAEDAGCVMYWWHAAKSCH